MGCVLASARIDPNQVIQSSSRSNSRCHDGDVDLVCVLQVLEVSKLVEKAFKVGTCANIHFVHVLLNMNSRGRFVCMLCAAAAVLSELCLLQTAAAQWATG
jgi:hypothetical protein